MDGVLMERLSLKTDEGAMESFLTTGVSFFVDMVFLGSRLKYCSKPIPLETMKLVADVKLTGITVLSVSV